MTTFLPLLENLRVILFSFYQISHWKSPLTINVLASLKITACMLTCRSKIFFCIRRKEKPYWQTVYSFFIEWVYKNKSKDHQLLGFTKLALTYYLFQLLQVLEHHYFHILSLSLKPVSSLSFPAMVKAALKYLLMEKFFRTMLDHFQNIKKTTDTNTSINNICLTVIVLFPSNCFCTS